MRNRISKNERSEELSIKKMNRENLLNMLCRMGMQFKIGFIITDPCEPSNPIIFTNALFTEITGYTQEEVVGKNYKFLQGKDTNEETVIEIKENLKKNLYINKEILNYKKDGTPFWNDLVIQTINDENGQLLFHLGFIDDITKQKQESALLFIQQQIYIGIDKGYELRLLLQQICDVVEGFLPTGSRCSILEITADRRMIIGAANSLPNEYNKLIDGLEIIPNLGYCGAAAANGEYIVTEDIRLSPNWKSFLDVTEKYKLSSCWSFPVINHENRVIATFGMYFSEPRKPTQMDLRVCTKNHPISFINS